MKYIKNKKIIFIVVFVLSFIILYAIYTLYNTETKEVNANPSEVIEIKDKINIKPLENNINIIRPSEKIINTSEETLTFTGMSDPNKDLKLNDKKLDVYYTGNFVIEVPLNIGTNNFKFTLEDKTLNYQVIRNSKIIDSITPSKLLSIEGGMKTSITAKLYSGAKAYAELNGERIELKQIESDEFISARGTTYATFKGTLNTNEVKNKTSLGHIVIHSSFNGTEETKEGGEVILNKPETKTTIGIINKDSAAVYDNKTISVTPLVEVYPLAKGTKDYISSKVIVDSKEYYNLASNKRVKAEDVDIATYSEFDNNEISNISIYEDDDSVYLKIKENWKAPYSFLTDNLNFKDKENQDYTIDDYSIGKFKIVFDYVTNINSKIDFKENSLFSTAKVINEDGKNYLSLSLKDNHKYNGHFAYYDDDGKLIFKFRNIKKNLKDMTIVIDPGHGLIENNILDSGALGFNDINENIINMQISKLIEAELKVKGVNVLRLDTENVSYPLKNRGSLARENNADLYLSIHNNSGASGKYNANESYYFTPYSMNYAKNINESLTKCYNDILFKDVEGEYSRGFKYNDYTVTLERENPSVLVEIGYIDNPISFNKLIDKDYQRELAKVIISGIEKTLQ